MLRFSTGLEDGVRRTELGALVVEGLSCPLHPICPTVAGCPGVEDPALVDPTR